MSLYRKRRNDFIPTNEVISSVSFSIFTPEEIKQLAVKKIITPLTFDTLGHPIPGGLYDRFLGPMNDKSDSCGTCQKLISKCPGHMGYIELPLPVINPMFHHLIGNILKISCLRCFTIQLPVQIKTCLAIQVKLLNRGMIAEALELDDLINAVAIKIESKEDIPNEIQKTIKLLDQLARSVKDKADGDIQLTKEAEQLRKQFAVNITKYFKQGKCCISCSQFGDRLKYQKNRIILHYKSDKGGDNTVVKEYLMKYVNPDESRNYLRGIWKKEPDLLMLIAPVLANFKNREHPTDIFYFEVIPVPPPMCRPANYLKGKMSEHPKTNAYRSILQNSIILNTIIYVMKQEGEDTGELSAEAKDVYNSTKGNSAVEKLNNVWETLQSNIDGIMDKDLSRQNEFLGLKQIIEKKQGMLRMHMMGKRVNFSARSVITPDPNLKIDEIGIPETFAKQLTYPTYVNSHNIEELRKMVMNGPNIHPGAAMVEFQNGNIIRLDPKNPLQRESIAKRLLTPTEVKNQDYREQKLVHRHLCNGDILLLNRQPSLHKPSVMAHKARILRGERTFRLHYANCKAYNADFDGDEMNAHFPQSEKARSEAQCIVNVSNQYLVPKDGTPLSGLIQDHVISGVKLSMRGRFFNKMNYNHLVFQALYHRTRNIKTLPPAIIKPEMLWSGKQVLSTIIMNIIPDGKELINLTSESKIKARDWQNTPPRPWKAGGTPFEDDLEMSESRVIVRHGELLSGVLDKSHYGATPYGLIHCVYELYGGPCATEMLSSLTRLFTTYLQKEGFTLGVEDIITLASADKKRRRIIRNLRTVGPEIMKKALNISGDVTEDEIVEMLDKKLVDNPNFTALVDKEYKFNLNNFTNQMNKASMTGLLSKFPKNNLQLMVTSGAKGSTVNTMQISCCLGQIELEGKRPPRMISGKTLPSFTRSEFSPRSGGFIEQRFMTGIQPQEFFFHCMAGREGLVDTAVKTSRSGYLQRCLVKSLEGVHVKADLTVRDSDNRVIQFLYGQDGMDVGKAQFLLKKHLPFLHENVHAILDKKFIKAEAKTERSLTVKEYTKMIKDWKSENESPLSKRKLNPFTLFSKFFAESSDRELTKDQLVQLWREAGDEVRQSFVDKCKQCPDTLNSTFYPHSHFGSINERIENLIKNYEGCTGKKDKKTFENMMKQKSMTSLCDTGEAVGLLAAQSIGEPSTQMTLNTFHFAGRGEMNVTLGIPRLREILMMASKNIKTPSMEIPFLPTDNLEHESETLRKKLNRVTVSDVLQDVEVEIASDVKKFVYRYTLKFIFLRHRRYIKDYCVNPKYVIKHMRKKFFKLLLQVIAKQNKFNDMVVIGESKRANREVEDDEVQQDLPAPESDSSDEEPEDEDDAKARKKYEAVHDDQEDEDEEMEETRSENEGEEENAAMNGSKIDDTDLQFMSTYRMVEDITCDQEKYLWCQMTFTVPFKNAHFDLTSLLKEVAAKSVIWEVPNIKKSITYMKDGVMTLRTDGINIPEMFKYDKILDLNKLYCNDIHKMIEHFGVEAGMAAIEKEIKDVFQVYGITIDPRHLLLISEFMTWKGTFEPMNRAGMQNSASPFQQMSFEASLTFLKEAVIGGKLDDLSNPSSSLMAGTISSIGSGGFDLLTKFSLCS